jgi:hypothetical protein
MTPRLPPGMRRGRPKYGVIPPKLTPEEERQRYNERKSEREKTIEKFGPIADERRADRRQMSMSPDEVTDWLKRNNINDGVDRRKADRRRR